MSYTFRKAIRENVSLIIALAGGTGSGKTYSALRLATGMSHGKPFCVVDTENGRASHYADQFTFDVCDLRAPFRPEAYAAAIQAADQAKYPVIIVDSASHEHAGPGGLLDWQEEELQRLAGEDWKKREACKMAAWVRPKLSHKAMMNTLLQVKAHIILAFRAEEKIEMVRDPQTGKMEVRAKQTLSGKDGWVPICEKTVPFEATCSFLLLASEPGRPHPIKLPEQMKGFIHHTPLDEKAGELLWQWAAGGQAQGGSLGDKVPAGDYPPVRLHPGPSGQPPPSDMEIVMADYRRAFERAATVNALTSEANKMEMDGDLTPAQRGGLRLYFKECLGKLQKRKP